MKDETRTDARAGRARAVASLAALACVVAVLAQVVGAYFDLSALQTVRVAAGHAIMGGMVLERILSSRT